MALIEVRNLTKVFPRSPSSLGADGGEVRAVDGVSLDIHAGETLGLVGESGSGKSTLGRLILRLIEPTAGTILLEGRDLSTASHGEMRRLRRDLQIIFQDPFASLDPRFRVEQIISEPLIIHGRAAVETREEISHQAPAVEERPFRAALSKVGGAGFDRCRSAPASAPVGIRSRVVELLGAVGLDQSALHRYPHEFSGGQRQRIGIARALALRPKFIVCDEPVSALDVSVGAQIVNLLARLQREFGLTYLFISHSMPVVRYVSTRIAVMHRGKIVEVGETRQISESPAHPYTRSLIEATPQLIS